LPARAKRGRGEPSGLLPRVREDRGEAELIDRRAADRRRQRIMQRERPLEQGGEPRATVDHDVCAAVPGERHAGVRARQDVNGDARRLAKAVVEDHMLDISPLLLENRDRRGVRGDGAQAAANASSSCVAAADAAGSGCTAGVVTWGLGVGCPLAGRGSARWPTVRPRRPRRAHGKTVPEKPSCSWVDVDPWLRPFGALIQRCGGGRD